MKLFLYRKGRGRLKTVAVAIAAALVCSWVTIFLVAHFSVFHRLDQFVQDWEIASVFAPREPQESAIIIVAVDEATLSRFPYRSPVDRAFLSTLLRQLSAHQPKAIALDFLLDQPTEPDKDAMLHKTLRELKSPLVVSYIASPDTVTPEQKAFEDDMVPAGLRGLADLPTDQFDTARDVFPGAKVDGRLIPGLAYLLAEKAGVRAEALRKPIVWHGRPPPTELDPSPRPFKQVSATVAGFMPDSWYRNKIILIGSDVTLVDRHRTPYSVIFAGNEGQLPGIVIQAHALSQLLHNKPSPVAGWELNFAVTFALALFGAGLGVVSAPLPARAAAILLLVPLFWCAGVALFHYTNTIVSLISPSLALITSFATLDSLGGREARRQRAFIQGAFSRYVSPKVVEKLVDDPSRMSLEGERREMTFLFTDIADFTTMSEKIESRELAKLLNGYLDGMTNIVLKHGGMVDKFIGDAVFAIFNAPIDLPGHAAKAVRCMLEMDDFAQRYRAEQKAAGVPLGATRIGVHSGVAVVGNFGSHARFTYTASGDAVNTAARVEGINKYLGTRLCVSETTRQLCSDLAFRPAASVVLKGKSEALDLWEPLPDSAGSEFLAAYCLAYERLRHGDGQAISLFAALRRDCPSDPLVQMHAERLGKGIVGVTMVMAEK